MQVINRQKDALPARLTLAELGAAMAQLNLSSIPPHKRQQAVMDHLMMVMAETVEDRSKAQEIIASRMLRAKGV